MMTSRTVAALAEDALQRLGERDSLLFQGERVSNVTILDRARRLQRAFAGLGLGKGNVATLCMVNHPLVYSVFGGIFRTGGTAVPMMFQLTPAELNYIIGHTEAQGVVTDASLVVKVRHSLEENPTLKALGSNPGVETSARISPCVAAALGAVDDE